MPGISQLLEVCTVYCHFYFVYFGEQICAESKFRKETSVSRIFFFIFKKNNTESGQWAKTWEPELIAKYYICRMKYPLQGTKLSAKN